MVLNVPSSSSATNCIVSPNGKPIGGGKIVGLVLSIRILAPFIHNCTSSTSRYSSCSPYILRNNIVSNIFDICLIDILFPSINLFCFNGNEILNILLKSFGVVRLIPDIIPPLIDIFVLSNRLFCFNDNALLRSCVVTTSPLMDITSSLILIFVP